MAAYKCLFVGLLLHAALPLCAQDILSRYTRYTTRDGLSHPNITCLAKDNDGFLWVGTSEGLCRFDGDYFEVMLKNSSSNSIGNNRIQCLLGTNNNLLFAGTNYGLNIINTKTLEVKNIYFEAPYSVKEKTNSVISMMANPNGGIWVNLLNGIALVDKAGKVLKQLLLSENKDAYTNSSLVKIFHVYPDGTPVFLSNNYQFLKPDFNERKFVQDTLLMRGTAIEHVNPQQILISSVSKNADGSLYIVYGDRKSRDAPGIVLQLNLANHSNKVFQPYNGALDKRLFQAFDLNDSIIFVTAYFGTPLLYNKQTGKTIKCSQPPDFFSSWPDGLANCFLKDGNNIWIGTHKELYLIKMGAPAFENMSSVDSVLERQASLVSVGNVMANGSNLAITCMGSGILLLNRNTQHSKLYTYNRKESRYSVSNFSFFKNADTIWNASNYGLTYIDLKTNQTGKLIHSSKPISLDFGVRTPFIDSKNNFWCTFGNSIYRFSQQSQSFEEILPPKDKAGNDLLDLVGDITEDPQGNIYFGGLKNGGIFKYTPLAKTWENIINSIEYKDFSSGVALNMAIRKNVMYLHTREAFAELNLQTKAFCIYTKIDGISTTDINDIAVDKNGYVWIATTNGLNCFNPSQKNFTTFYMQDGLPSDNISSVGMIDIATNLMYIGTEKAFRFFKPNLLLGEKMAPVIVITGIKNIRGEKLKTQDARLDLLYNNNNIEIEYTGINFDNGSLNNYSYRLRGKDNNWIEAGNKKAATYTNLAPGEYVFEVKGANRQGIWNDVPAKLSIIIKPPFWKTWWFYLLMLIFASAMILLIFYMQHLGAKKREAEKIRINNQLNDLRMKALRSQLNPHFIFNALNSIQSYVMDKNSVEASRYLSKFAKLFRLVLENTDANFTTLQKEISLLRHYIELEALRFNNSFGFDIEVAENINIELTNIPSMLLQPHVENAILHGLSSIKNGRLSIHFSRYQPGSIACTISDNGIGRKQAAAIKLEKFNTHESKGLLILEQRMQLLETQYQLQSSYTITDLQDANGNTGTLVKVLLPVQNSVISTSNNSKL